MFDSEVKAFIQNVKRVRNAKPSEPGCTIEVEFYITPIIPELAVEISPAVREALFRYSEESGWTPRSTVTEVDLNETIDNQRMTWRSHEEVQDAVTVMGVEINQISAVRAYPDKPHLRLRFRATFEVDRDTLWELANRYWRQSAGLLLTFEPMEAALPFPDVEHSILCLSCNQKAEFMDSEGDPWCPEHQAEAGPGREVKPIGRWVADGMTFEAVAARADRAHQKKAAE